MFSSLRDIFLILALIVSFTGWPQQPVDELYLKGEEYCDAERYSEAFGYWEQAAQMGHVRAQCVVGVCYRDGIGVEPNGEKSEYWLKQAADKGDAEAQYYLADYYIDNSTSSNVNGDEILRLLQMSANKGFGLAIFRLGEIYYSGDFMSSPNPEKTIGYLSKAAEKSNAYAQFYLGEYYMFGRVVSQDIERAEYWLFRAAAQGMTEAIDLLVEQFCYYKEEHGEYFYDSERADEILSQLSDGGNAYASYRKGMEDMWKRVNYRDAYSNKDYWDVYENLSRAVNLTNNGETRPTLGDLYNNKKWLKDRNENYATSTSIMFMDLEISAQYGHADAQCLLALMYEEGINIDKDVDNAIYWYRRAAQYGNAEAIKALERLGVSVEFNNDKKN